MPHVSSFILGNNFKNFSKKGKYYAFSSIQPILTNQGNFVLQEFRPYAFRNKLYRTVNFLFCSVLTGEKVMLRPEDSTISSFQ